MAHRASIRTIMLTGAALCATVLGSGTAQAGGFYVHEQSTYFEGTAWAGAAAGGPSLSSMFWNPATITQHGPGLSSETSAAYINANIKETPTLATLGAFNLA